MQGTTDKIDKYIAYAALKTISRAYKFSTDGSSPDAPLTISLYDAVSAIEDAGLNDRDLTPDFMPQQYITVTPTQVNLMVAQN